MDWSARNFGGLETHRARSESTRPHLHSVRETSRVAGSVCCVRPFRIAATFESAILPLVLRSSSRRASTHYQPRRKPSRVCRRTPRSSKCCNAAAATCSSMAQKRAACGVVTVRSGISSKSTLIRQQASSVMLRLTPRPRPVAIDSGAWASENSTSFIAMAESADDGSAFLLNFQW